MPFALDIGKTSLNIKWYSFTINFKRNFLMHGLLEFIEITWHRIIPGPTGDTNVNGECITFLGLDADIDYAFPGVPGLLSQLNFIV